MGTYSAQGYNLHRWSGSKTETGEMAQGAYSTWNSGQSQAGSASFSGITNLDVVNNKITSFTLTMHFTNAGGNWAKKMQFYSGKNLTSAYAFATFQTDGAAYNATKTHTWTDAASIAALIKGISEGRDQICCYIAGETASSGYSGNYCKIDSISITINYTDATRDLGIKYYNGSSWKTIGEAWRYTGTTGSLKTVPPTAFSSNYGADGYSCFADSEYATDFGAWRAFNKNTGNNDTWASAESATASSHSITLVFPELVYVRSITVKNRVFDNASEIRGPISMRVYGETWTGTTTFLLGTKTNMPGSTSGGSTTMNFTSNKAVGQVRLLFQDWQTKGNSGSHIAIGEITMDVVKAPWEEITEVKYYNGTSWQTL